MFNFSLDWIFLENCQNSLKLFITLTLNVKDSNNNKYQREAVYSYCIYVTELEPDKTTCKPKSVLRFFGG